MLVTLKISNYSNSVHIVCSHFWFEMNHLKWLNLRENIFQNRFYLICKLSNLISKLHTFYFSFLQFLIDIEMSFKPSFVRIMWQYSNSRIAIWPQHFFHVFFKYDHRVWKMYILPASQWKRFQKNVNLFYSVVSPR